LVYILRAMVAHVDSTLPRATCTSRAWDFHVPRSFLLCVLSLGLALNAAHALDPNKRLTQYAHTAWRIQDGFLPNTPYYISQTEDGYLWVGDLAGAWRFDGVRFTPWSAPIASTPLFRPVSVRTGGFWIATRNELDHVRGNVVISRYEIPANSVYKDSDESVWTLSHTDPDRVLCHATDTQIRCFGKAEGLTIRMAATFIPDGKGGFWIGGDTSLFHWKMGAAPEIYNFPQLQLSVGAVGIRSLLEDSDGSLWVGLAAAGPGLGLERFRNGVLTPVVLPNFNGSKFSVFAIMEDSDKNLWISTVGNGIYRIHGQTVDHFGRADGLSSDNVHGLYESNDGIVWAATSDGIDNFRELPVTTFSASEGLGRGSDAVMAAKDGTVWVGSGTLDFVRNGAVSSVRVNGEQVSSTLEDHQGNIWVGIDDGLFLYKDGRFRRIPEPDHHPLGLVVGIAEDVDGNIWAECKGVQRRLIRIRDFMVREEFSESQVPAAHSIAADPKGGIWLGTLTGDLTFFREGIAHTFSLQPKSKSMEATVARQISVDPDGSVITAPVEGLVMLRAGKVERLGKKNGLPCDGVYGFAVDDNKNLWLSTPCGYVEIAASDVQRWRDHPDTMVQVRVFDALDGARTGYTSFNPAAKSPDGRLWFANQVVLQMIDPSHLSGHGTVSPVYVDAVLADRKQYKPQEGLQLPPLIRDLQIGYTSPSFLIPQKVKFRYRLDGRDHDWQDAGARREAFYAELGPGKYRFRVIACNNLGVWNEPGASFDFFVAPAYYQTNWFRSLCAVGFLALLWGAYQLRVRQLQRQFNIGLEARVNERTRIARELHDTLLQNFHGLMFQVQAASNLMLRRPDEAKRSLDDAIDETKKALAESRDAIQGLRSEPIAKGNLAELLASTSRELAGSNEGEHQPVFDLIEEGERRTLSPTVSNDICRTALELVRNAYQHAHAHRIETEIRYGDSMFRLRIRDDGQGIEPKVLKEGGRVGHWGLRGIRERADRIGARLEVWSEPGNGTEVQLLVPAAIAYEGFHDSYRAKLIQKVKSRAKRS
jgi:signal transduction histidine kinase/ligand-binding sensor domain-containing protein